MTRNLMDKVKQLFHAYAAKLIRFFLSGGSAAITNLLVLYICTAKLHIYYVLSSVISFAVSFVVSFTLQKFWTFRDKTMHTLNRQMLKYLTITLINLGVNTLLIYVFVESFHLHYMFAQVMAMMVIAIWSFFIYHFLIFKNEPKLEKQ